MRLDACIQRRLSREPQAEMSCSKMDVQVFDGLFQDFMTIQRQGH